MGAAQGACCSSVAPAPEKGSHDGSWCNSQRAGGERRPKPAASPSSSRKGRGGNVLARTGVEGQASDVGWAWQDKAVDTAQGSVDWRAGQWVGDDDDAEEIHWLGRRSLLELLQTENKRHDALIEDADVTETEMSVEEELQNAMAELDRDRECGLGASTSRVQTMKHGGQRHRGAWKREDCADLRLPAVLDDEGEEHSMKEGIDKVGMESLAEMIRKEMLDSEERLQFYLELSRANTRPTTASCAGVR